MKRLIKLLIIGLLISSNILSYANSGPVYWPGRPYSDAMLVDTNSPIEVRGENLTFDFSQYDTSYYSYECLVTAEYDMFNPTNENLSVQMAFPFIESINNISYEDINIFAGDEKLSYEIFLGDLTKSVTSGEESQEKDFDFAKIIETIKGDTYEGDNFNEDDLGKLYTIEVDTDSDDTIEIAINFNFDPEKTKILSKGFRGLEREGEKTRLTASVRNFDKVEIYVLGQDIDFSVEGYTDGTLEEKTDKYGYQVFEGEIDVRTYIYEITERFVNNSFSDKLDNTSNIQIYNIFAEALDTEFSRSVGYCSSEDLVSYGRMDRVISLVYTVEFPKEASKTVSVGYKTMGTMDMRETVEPLYTYEYILNPAKNWSSFKDLNIRIIPPQDLPYIVDSNIDFQKEANSYISRIESLPEEDLTFTLYHKDKVTLMDKIQGKLRGLVYFAYFFIPLFIVLVIIIVSIVVIRKFIKKIK